MPIHIERSDAAVRVIVDETLRAEDLSLVEESLRRQGQRSVVVEFRRTRDCAPPNLMGLLTLLRGRGTAYEFIGLPGHCRRLLEDLQAAPAAPAAAGPEDDFGGG